MKTFLDAINAEVTNPSELVSEAAGKIKEWLTAEFARLGASADAVEGITDFLSNVPAMTEDKEYNIDVIESDCPVFGNLSYNTNGFLTFEFETLPEEIVDAVRVALLHAGDVFWSEKVGAIPFSVSNGDDIILDTVFTVSWANRTGEYDFGMLLHEGTDPVEV